AGLHLEVPPAHSTLRRRALPVRSPGPTRGCTEQARRGGGVMSRVDVRGCLALVTGAGSGIGRATALAFADAGARLLAVDIDREAAEKTAAECAERGVESVAYEADVADRVAVAGLADVVHNEHGPLDILVNNAGVGMSARFLAMSLEDWDWIVSINLMGAVHMCHAFGPQMVERGRGHVVNISSG